MHWSFVFPEAPIISDLIFIGCVNSIIYLENKFKEKCWLQILVKFITKINKKCHRCEETKLQIVEFPEP